MRVPAAHTPVPRAAERPGRRPSMGLVLAVACAACVLLTPLAGAAAGDEPEVGQPAPDFNATDSLGHVRRLSEFRGKTVVLEWTNADCPFTRKHYTSGNMQSLQE